MGLPQTARTSTAFSMSDRRILFLSSIIGFVAGYAGSQMPHTLPFARTALELSEGNMSAVFAGVRAVSLLGVLFSMAADTGGRKRPILAAYSVLLIASLGTALIPSVAAYVATQAIVRVAVVARGGLSVDRRGDVAAAERWIRRERKKGRA